MGAAGVPATEKEKEEPPPGLPDVPMPRCWGREAPYSGPSAGCAGEQDGEGGGRGAISGPGGPPGGLWLSAGEGRPRPLRKLERGLEGKDAQPQPGPPGVLGLGRRGPGGRRSRSGARAAGAHPGPLAHPQEAGKPAHFPPLRSQGSVLSSPSR